MAGINNMEEDLHNCEGGISNLDTQSGERFKKIAHDVYESAKTGTKKALAGLALCTGVAMADESKIEISLDNGTQITITEQNGEYVPTVRAVGDFAQAFYTKKGESLYVIGDGHEVDIMNFGKYEDLGKITPEEQAFLDFQKSKGQTEFLAMLTIGKAEFLGKGGNPKVWSSFVVNNLGAGFADEEMTDILKQIDTLAYYLNDKGSDILYWDDFEEEAIAYKNAGDFIEAINDIADIAESKENIAESKENIAESKENIAENNKIQEEIDREIAKNKQEIAKNKQEIAKNKQEIAKNRAIYDAYAKVIGALN